VPDNNLTIRLTDHIELAMANAVNIEKGDLTMYPAFLKLSLAG